MSVSQNISISCDGSSASNTYTAGTSVVMNEAFGASSDQLMALTIDVSQMKTLYLHSDVACTLETNSSGSPATTLALVAGQPIVWTSTGGQVNPLGTTDVTALYVSAAAAGTLTIRYLIDPTV